MAGTIIADTWQNGDGTQNYKCRAWVNFNGAGTVAIRASGNVSSITDVGTGNFTVNFANAMPDVNYAAESTAQNHLTYSGEGRSTWIYSYSTTGVRFGCGKFDGNVYDSEFFCVAVFR